MIKSKNGCFPIFRQKEAIMRYTMMCQNLYIEGKTKLVDNFRKF